MFRFIVALLQYTDPPDVSAAAAWHNEPVSGNVQRFETGDEDNFTQVGIFFRKVLNQQERERLTDNIAGSLSGAQEFIQKRAIANFAAADSTYGRMIADKIEKLKKTTNILDIKKAAAALSPPRKSHL